MEHERGQVVPLVMAVLVLIAALAVGVAGLGVRAVGRARAQSAADAAALAAATVGPVPRRRAIVTAVATANGADLVTLRTDGPVVVVTVRIGATTAQAAASWVSGRAPSAPSRPASEPKAGASGPRTIP